MTNKQNTIVFIVVGTLVNLIISFAFVIVLTLLAMLLLKEKAAFFIPIAMGLGLLIGIFIYQKIAGWVIKKFNLEHKLDPLFSKKFKKR